MLLSCKILTCVAIYPCIRKNVELNLSFLIILIEDKISRTMVFLSNLIPG